MQEAPTVGVKFNTDYLRLGNIKFNDQSWKIRFQEESFMCQD